MIKLKFFALLLSVESLSRTSPKCFTSIDPAYPKSFGDIRYIPVELAPCIDLIVENDSESIINDPSTDCNTAIDALDGSKSVITCSTTDNTATCPTAPEECEIITASRDQGTCVYSCKHSLIGCQNEAEFPFELKVDQDNSWCFEKSYSSCVVTETDYENNNQERQSCTYNSCGFKDTALYTLTFNENEIINTYDTGNPSNPAGDVFECDENTKKTPSGCSCKFDGSAVTVMECKKVSYIDLCTDTDCEIVDSEKNDSVCYKGTPLMKYDSIICDVSDNRNENEEIFYCKRGEKAYLPCGNLLHACSDSADSKSYNCECTGFDSSNKCPVEIESGKCLIKEIPLAQPMDSCTKRVCFDNKFDQQTTCPTDFAATMWQCYDEFEFINIANNPTTKNFDAQKKNGSYDDLLSCLKPKCINGNCVCEDTEEKKAENHCGEFYLSQKNLDSKKQNNDDLETSKLVEFQCYSYNKTFSAINDVNDDVNRASECRELKEPAPSENAKCPGPCNPALLSFGFYDCQCDKKCSYDCGNSKYDPIYNTTKPDNWDDITDGNYYVGYTCEKDNLVMIICTSIFVPLGVAGIAAGVYFFFFHESSEVAPVETDNELASTTSNEHNQVEEDKEETYSEIAKDN